MPFIDNPILNKLRHMQFRRQLPSMGLNEEQLTILTAHEKQLVENEIQEAQQSVVDVIDTVGQEHLTQLFANALDAVLTKNSREYSDFKVLRTLLTSAQFVSTQRPKFLERLDAQILSHFDSFLTSLESKFSQEVLVQMKDLILKYTFSELKSATTTRLSKQDVETYITEVFTKDMTT